MSDAREQEIRALKDLLASDGWAYLEGAKRTQWEGEAFVGRMKSAKNGLPTEGQQCESVKEVFAGREAIEGFLLWPQSRLKKLEADATREAAVEPDMVRRA